MIINPKTRDSYKKSQAKTMKRLSKEIKKLPRDIRELISQGEEVIDESFRFQEVAKKDLKSFGVNVFDLSRNIPGEVMKYLIMIYSAAGFLNVMTLGGCWYSGGPRGEDTYRYRVFYPNAITMDLIG